MQQRPLLQTQRLPVSSFTALCYCASSAQILYLHIDSFFTPFLYGVHVNLGTVKYFSAVAANDSGYENERFLNYF